MHGADPYLAEREMKLRVAAELDRAQARGLLKPAVYRRRETLAQRGQWLLCQLGYHLVALGARLEAYSLAQEG